MAKKRFRWWTLGVLVGLAIALKWVSFYPAWMERNYTYGLYPMLSKLLRAVTGWVPFSLGDFVYATAGLLLVRFIWRSVATLRRNGFRAWWRDALYKISITFLVVYCWFNLFWGLNYDRLGVASQLQLQVQRYSLPEVEQLTQMLQQKLNTYAAQTDTIQRAQLDNNRQLFQKAIVVYRNAGATDAKLQYQFASIKPSIYSSVGHYFGFTGYYNPFSGEAQIKTSIPVFLKPFVATHEIAHQLGYARENEANFVAFLAGKQSDDVNVLYSLYYNLYGYAVREVYARDTTSALVFRKNLDSLVLRDNAELKAYLLSTENKIEPLVTKFYDQYLKWNNQAAGVQTYNEVVALLIAYGKKYGWSAI